MNTYNQLPYFRNEDFPSTEYSKAAAIRTPVRDAINTARSMPEHKMDQVILVLETALAHIRQGKADEVIETPVVDDGIIDPLDLLLGSAEA